MDDSKVAVLNAKLGGMKDFLVIPSTHPFIMKNTLVIQQTMYFLQHGTFLRDDAQTATVAGH